MKTAILTVIIRGQVVLSNEVIAEFLSSKNVKLIPAARAFYSHLDIASNCHNTDVEHSKYCQERGKEPMAKKTEREKQ